MLNEEPQLIQQILEKYQFLDLNNFLISYGKFRLPQLLKFLSLIGNVIFIFYAFKPYKSFEGLSIINILGERGTGKTKFIRNLFKYLNLFYVYINSNIICCLNENSNSQKYLFLNILNNLLKQIGIEKKIEVSELTDSNFIEYFFDLIRIYELGDKYNFKSIFLIFDDAIKLFFLYPNLFQTIIELTKYNNISKTRVVIIFISNQTILDDLGYLQIDEKLKSEKYFFSPFFKYNQINPQIIYFSNYSRDEIIEILINDNKICKNSEKEEYRKFVSKRVMEFYKYLSNHFDEIYFIIRMLWPAFQELNIKFDNPAIIESLIRSYSSFAIKNLFSHFYGDIIPPSDYNSRNTNSPDKHILINLIETKANINLLDEFERETVEVVQEFSADHLFLSYLNKIFIISAYISSRSKKNFETYIFADIFENQITNKIENSEDTNKKKKKSIEAKLESLEFEENLINKPKPKRKLKKTQIIEKDLLELDNHDFTLEQLLVISDCIYFLKQQTHICFTSDILLMITALIDTKMFSYSKKKKSNLLTSKTKFKININHNIINTISNELELPLTNFIY